MAAFLLLTTAAAFLAGSAQAQPTVPVCNMDASHLTKDDGELDMMKGLALLSKPDEYCEENRAELPPLICLLIEKNKLTGLKSKCADPGLVMTNPLIQKVLKGEAVTIDDIKAANGKKFCDCFASQLPMHALCENLPAGQDDCSIGKSTVRELLEACVQEYHGCDYALQKDDHTKTCAEAKRAQKARNGANVDGCGKVVGGTTATATTAAALTTKAGDGSPTTAPKNVDDKKMSAQKTKDAEVAVGAAKESVQAAKDNVAQAKAAGDADKLAEAEAALKREEAKLAKAETAVSAAAQREATRVSPNDESAPTTEATTADAEMPTQPASAEMEDISSSQETVEEVDIAKLEKVAAAAEKQYTESCATDTQKASQTCKTLKASSAAATKAVEDAGGGGSAASGLSPLLATCVAGLAAAAGAL